jgi:RNA polymerase sigma-70 factor, ECF subfamily
VLAAPLLGVLSGMDRALTGFMMELQGSKDLLMPFAIRLTGNKADAEDLIHSALVKALEHESNLPAETNWMGWLRQVMRRMAIDMSRRRRRWRVADDYDLAELPVRPDDTSPSWIEISPEELGAALETCKAVYREVYDLYHVHGLSYGEIARRLDIPICTVSTRLHRLRAQLRASLGPTSEIELSRARGQLQRPKIADQLRLLRDVERFER